MFSDDVTRLQSKVSGCASLFPKKVLWNQPSREQSLLSYQKDNRKYAPSLSGKSVGRESSQCGTRKQHKYAHKKQWRSERYVRLKKPETSEGWKVHLPQSESGDSSLLYNPGLRSGPESGSVRLLFMRKTSDHGA